MFGHRGRIGQHGSGLNPIDGDPLLTEPCVTGRVMAHSLFGAVALAIHLHSEAGVRTVEVQDVWTHRVLAAEVWLILAADAQAGPEHGLGWGQGAAQGPGPFVG